MVTSLAALLLAVSADLPAGQAGAASWFVTVTGGGAFSGGDWNNAWSGGQINWGSVNPGDTVYLAGGGRPYTKRFHVQASGTPAAPITIKRVVSTDVAATSAAGWSASFDRSVQFGVSNYFGIDFDGWQMMSNIVVDGRVDHGWQIFMPDLDNAAGVALSNSCIGLTLTNLEVIGPGSPNTAGYPFRGDVRGMQLYGAAHSRNTRVTHCRIHGVVDAIYAIGNTGLTVDHCQIYDIWACTPSRGAQQHDNVLINYNTTNCTFSHNQIWNWASEGIGFFGYATNWSIYGNVWHDSSMKGGASTARCIESQAYSNGPVYFFNNTVANSWITSNCGNGGAWARSCAARNNILWNLTVPGPGLPNNDYDFCSGTLGAREPHGINHGSYPFLSRQGRYPYVSTNNLQIVPTVGAKFPAGKGVNLGQRVDEDAYGNAWPTVGNWSMGAHNPSR